MRDRRKTGICYKENSSEVYCVIRKETNSTIGLLLFLTAVTMFFVGVFGAYIIAHPGMSNFISDNFSLHLTYNTVILLVSSLTLVSAQRYAASLNKHGVVAGLLSTLVLGALFLWMQCSLWSKMLEKGMTLSVLSGANFYLMSGAHLLHILVGLFVLGWVTYKIICGGYADDYYKGVNICGIYWHFMDMVWLAIYILLVFWK